MMFPHHDSPQTYVVTQEMKAKYEAIPEGDRTVAHNGFLTGILCFTLHAPDCSNGN